MDKFTRFFSTDSIDSTNDSPTNEEQGFAAQVCLNGQDASSSAHLLSTSLTVALFFFCLIYPRQLPQLMDASTFSWSTRIKGFGICFVGGLLLSILGIAFLSIPFKGPILFGIFYTVGNIMSIASTCFLMGPWKQLKKMFNETRLVATLAMFVFMGLTLWSAFASGKKLRTLIFCFCQFLSMTWYSLSYIPYARDAVKKTVTSCI